jgi:glutathione S-transferase
MSASTDVTPTLGAVIGVLRSTEPHAPTAEHFKGRLRSYMKVWDEALAKQKYAAGNEVTIADFSLYAGYARAQGAMPEVCEGFSNLGRWAKEMAARPGVQRAVKF